MNEFESLLNVINSISAGSASHLTVTIAELRTVSGLDETALMVGISDAIRGGYIVPLNLMITGKAR